MTDLRASRLTSRIVLARSRANLGTPCQFSGSVATDDPGTNLRDIDSVVDCCSVGEGGDHVLRDQRSTGDLGRERERRDYPRQAFDWARLCERQIIEPGELEAVGRVEGLDEGVVGDVAVDRLSDGGHQVDREVGAQSGAGIDLLGGLILLHRSDVLFAPLVRVVGLPKPIIAAVNGFAMGGGLEIALACHLIVADERAELALSEVQVGLIAGAGGLVRLPRQLPTKVADEMILTGRRMGAQEALDRGLVNVVTGPGEAMTGARELAAQIMRGSPTSVRISLQVMEETASIVDPIDAVTQPSTAFDDLMFSEDTSEGLAAFSAKRAPQWRNR